MTETYASGVAAIKELANTMQRKASSDLEEMDSAFSSQIAAIEQVLFYPKKTQVACESMRFGLIFNWCSNFVFVVPGHCGA